MRKFKVALKFLSEREDVPDGPYVTIFIPAKDFNVESATSEHGIYLNFWIEPEGEDAQTVAIVPFDSVLYVTEEP